MLGRRDRQLRILPARQVVYQRVRIAGFKLPAHRRFKAQRPVIGLARVPAPRVSVEVVHHVAAAQHQDSLLAQRPQAYADLMMEAPGLSLINTQLHDRHVGLRVHVTQHRPGAVIQAPALIGLHRQGPE